MYVKILRPVNLLLIALTQYAIYYRIIKPGIESSDQILRFDYIYLSLLIFSTICIAASGYVINDIIDSKADRINKPNKTYISNGISKKSGWVYYSILVVFGFISALIIAYKLSLFNLLWIYPLSVLILYLYSSKLKFTAIGGNIVVALFTAFVPLILLITQDGSLAFGHYNFTAVVLAFAAFSFFINFTREIVKDIEDVEGDKSASYNSIAISMGTAKANVFALFNTILLLILIITWLFSISFYNYFRMSSFAFIFLIAPLILVVFRLQSARQKNDYSRISALLKYIMFAGLLFILIFGNIQS